MRAKRHAPRFANIRFRAVGGLSATPSRQAGMPVVPIRVFSQGGWSIYEVTHEGEPGYLFFRGQPRPFPKTYLWGGSALPNEYDDILAGVRSNAKGIPSALAVCFAHAVTGRKW